MATWDPAFNLSRTLPLTARRFRTLLVPALFPQAIALCSHTIARVLFQRAIALCSHAIARTVLASNASRNTRANYFRACCSAS